VMDRQNYDIKDPSSSGSHFILVPAIDAGKKN